MQDVMSNRDRDLVLPPNTYAYVLDSTKGKVSVYVGPYKNSLSNTDQLVVWDSQQSRFTAVSDVEKAIKTFVKAGEGQYIVLSDPAARNAQAHPPVGNSTESTELDVGRKVNIPGPATFPLWPGQTAQTIEGHQLRYNQYLIVRVYEPEQARENWTSAVVAPQVPTAPVGAQGEPAEGGEGQGEMPGPSQPPAPADVLGETSVPRMFTMGQLIVIKGTDFSFYIPSTGVEVVPEPRGTFVREAATLEQLEYCILLDESGQKRFMRGPDVVFPEPTETFVEENGNRKFRAIDLNEQSGLYIKVIAPYEDEDGTSHEAGEELFITGAQTPIYFPRPEHSIIQYGTQKKHHAIAIPVGEGRYVLDRTNGKVELIRGPNMFLPDPRTQVVVRRILDADKVRIWYPDNSEAEEINRRYRREQEALEPGQHLLSVEAARTSALRGIGDEERYAGDTTRRGTTFTPPRTIVLDTKYEGAVSINVWPGYAVLVTDKTGNRRVEVGPEAFLLEYDEALATLELSTGRPKNDDRLLRTVYLRTINNQVSDRVVVETRDLVRVTIDLSYRVNFEGDGDERNKWFDIENYVKVLTDHCRSRLRNAAKRYDILDFYTKTIDIIRDILLGATPDGGGDRQGLSFSENGMRLYDVEVLNVSIDDRDVEHLLATAMSNALRGAIQLTEAEQRTAREARLEELKRDSIDELERTKAKEAQVAVEELGRRLEQRLKEVGNELQVATEQQQVEVARRASREADEALVLDLQKRRNEVELARLGAEVDQYVKRVEAIDEGLVAAIQAFGDKNFVENLVEALGPAAMASGVTTADLMLQLFKDTPFEGLMGSLAQRPLARAGNSMRH